MQQSVKLIAVSAPDGRHFAEHLGAEGLIAYCARVSNPSNQNNEATADKLLGYMIRNKHWSPFEMVSATIEIITTRDIARQILRHRSFSFQEFSQRYSSEIEFAEPRGARLQDQKNRQNSIADGVDDDLAKDWESFQRSVIASASTAYQEALRRGVAKEVARSVLPEGLTVSRLYMAGTLRSWLHYIDLRSANGTQIEHQEVARMCREALREPFPNMIAAMEAIDA